MKNKLPMFLIGGFTILIIAGLAWLSSSQPSSPVPPGQQKPKPPIKVGQSAPNFKLQGIDKKTYNLADYKGQKAVFVELFAIWCPHCQAEAPRIDSIYSKYKEKGVAFFDIQASPYGKDYETTHDTSAASIEDFNFFKNTFHVTFPILQDQNSTTATNYGLTSYPTFYIIDKSGKVTYTNTGEVSPDELSSEIEKVL